MDHHTIYRGFVQWLERCGAYLPESDELMPLIRATFTAEEAEVLTGIPFTPCRLEEIATTKNMDAEELQSKLDEMAARGLIFRSTIGGYVTYRLADTRFIYLRSIFWPGTRTDHSRAAAMGVNRYYRDGFGDFWKHSKTKGLRVLPIRKTIDDPRKILPYEDAIAVLQNHDRIAVATCACRHRKNLDPGFPDCEHPTEVCLHFGSYADYIIGSNLGREIDATEAQDILSMAADSGLVHAVSNWLHGVDTICNCCKCCCVYFESFHVLKHSQCMNASNYEISTSPETCLGCGICVKRCHMDAIRLDSSPIATNKSGRIAAADPDLCIGCGLCVHKCPTGSLSLQRRAEIVDPPLDVDDLKMRYRRDVDAAKAPLRNNPCKP